MKPRIYRRHSLNGQIGRETTAEELEVNKQNSPSVKGVKEFLSCKNSAAVKDVKA